MIPVRFEPRELEVVGIWGDVLQRYKTRTAKRNNQFDMTQDGTNMQIVGKLAELASKRVYGGTIDWNVYKGGDGGTDLRGDNWTATVKCVTLSELSVDSLQFIVNRLSQFPTDIGILVQLCGNRSQPLNPGNVYNVIGHVTQSEFLRNHYRRDYGHGVRYAYDAKNMIPAETYSHYADGIFHVKL